MKEYTDLRGLKAAIREKPYWDSISIQSFPEKFKRWKRCIYCKGVLFDLDDMSNRVPHWGFATESTKLNACLSCGWWYIIHCFSAWSPCRTLQTLSATRGILLKSNVDPLSRAIPVLRKYVEQNTDRISHLSPLQMEVLLQDLMSDYFDCEVKWTGRGADGGFDLFAIIRDELAVIQIKHRIRKNKEPVRAIRELLGTMLLQGATSGVFITTANSFTRPARAVSESLSLAEKGMKLELIDNGKLLDIIRQFVPRPHPYPWSGLHGLP